MSDATPEGGGPDSLKSLATHVPRLGESVVEYFQAQADRFSAGLKLTLVQAAFWLFIVILFLEAGFLSLYLLMRGGSEGLGRVLGDRAWLGSIIVGASFLLLVVLALRWANAALRRGLVKARSAQGKEREAIEKNLSAISQDIAGVFAVRAWVQRFPLPATGASAVLGFWAGGQLVHRDSGGAASERAAASSSSGASEASPVWASLLEMAMATLTDVTKDAAHLWIQGLLQGKEDAPAGKDEPQPQPV